MRDFQTFSCKNAKFRISSPAANIIIDEIVHQREILDNYIKNNPNFLTSLKPLEIEKNAPEIVQRMDEASRKTGVGPMAAVAGVFAQISAEKALKTGCKEAIVENGGDIYILSRKTVYVGLYPGGGRVSKKLAFRIPADKMPISVCSSSGIMGHSISFGNCDLATVFSSFSALGDAAATLACNLTKKSGDINRVMEHIMSIKGIDGILLVINDKIGIMGEIPELVEQKDPDISNKITHDNSWETFLK